MGSTIFKTILSRKIENFISSFGKDSYSIFYKGSKLIHPGELGRYREKSLKDLLQLIIGSGYVIGDGFIITQNDKISTQCDIIIYDNADLPLLVDGFTQFFTIESVCCIGEVKSTIDYADLKDALIKLSKNKMLAEDCSKDVKKEWLKEECFRQPFTFLVCQKIKTDINKLDLTELYGSIEQKYWHNLILSIEDGLMHYITDFSEFENEFKKRGINSKVKAYQAYPFRVFGGKFFPLNHEFSTISQTEKFKHINIFLHLILSSLQRKTLYNVDTIEYLDLPKVDLFINNKEVDAKQVNKLVNQIESIFEIFGDLKPKKKNKKNLD